MNATITRKVLPVDVGEVAAADLEAVVWAAVDLVEVAEEDSEEAAAAVFVEAVAVSVEATVEVIEVDEAVVGEVVAEAVEVTLMVKAARKLQNQKFKLQEQKKSFSRKKQEILKMHDEKNQLSLKRPPSRYEKKILYLKKSKDGRRKKIPDKFS